MIGLRGSPNARVARGLHVKVLIVEDLDRRKSALEYDAGTYVTGQTASAGESALNSRSMLENLQNESKKVYRDVMTKLKRLSHSDGMDESECDERLEPSTHPSYCPLKENDDHCMNCVSWCSEFSR